MKLFTYLSSAVIALTLSTASYADTKPTHSFGFQFGGGNMEYQGKEGDGFGSSYIHYNYQLTPLYALEVGLLGGGDADWDCRDESGDWECYADNNRNDLFELQADDLELGALVLAIKTDVALSKRHSLYGKLGLSYYDYELALDGQKIVEEDGVGYMLEGGWEYRWDMGIGMNVGLQYNKMDDLKATTLNAGVSYTF